MKQAAPACSAETFWSEIAVRVLSWLQANKIAAREAVVLLPFVQLLPLARRAFAARSGFMPRIETTRTLAGALGPPPPSAAGAPSLDAAFDGLVAQQMLSAQPWAVEWQRRDRRGFEAGAARLVATTHELVAAAGRLAPPARAGWWATARATMQAGAGPGNLERGLARIAVEWAALAPSPATDALFGLVPAAWIAVQAGGDDAFVGALFGQAAVPCLVLDADADADAEAEAAVDRPLFDRACVEPPAYAVCAGFEAEAEAATAQVLAHLANGERPVALIAEDRVIVRRVRALLERSRAIVVDETGWKLSTTRAAARLMSLLVAARRNATSDELFDWLKTGTDAARATATGVAVLEATCRKRAIWRVDGVAAMTLDSADADRVRGEALAVLAPLQASERRSVASWLETTALALARAGALELLRADAAGRQVLATLAIEGVDAEAAGARLATASEPVPLAEFTRWVDAALEHATFRPASGATAEDEVDVIVTPLARAMLRPFAAAVFAGADDRRLGAFAASDSLLSAATRSALGLVGPAARQHAQWLAFRHLLAVPRVTLLRRHADGAEPLAASPFVERLALALDERGSALRDWQDPSATMPVVAQPVLRSAAVAPARVPSRLSASSFDVLRACPYRFFAKSLLGVGEDVELDGDLEKRDYGSWLHEVLHTFHAQRSCPAGSVCDDEAGLRAAGASVLADSGFDSAEFLPWAATFDSFVPRYLAWLRKREALGARWTHGEAAFAVHPPGLEGVELRGVIDRIDAVLVDGVSSLELIDYKTGSASRLKKLAADRLEDTQLAFYAALAASESELPLKATYLALEARPALMEFEHRHVAASAAALLDGIAIDLRRLREGAGMMPLGEGDACRYCEARGLCRRDHWGEDAASVLDAAACRADSEAASAPAAPVTNQGSRSAS